MLNKILFFVVVCIVNISVVSAQKFTTKWQTTIGGNGDDILSNVQKTTDKGFIISGYSNSNTSGYKLQNSYSNSYDFWIVKLDSGGHVQWSKTYGGADDDNKPLIIQTSDGGYLAGGTSISNMSDVKAESRFDSSYDFWLLKLDANGNIQWENTIGGSFCEYLGGLTETADSYLAGGLAYSDSSHDKTQNNTGSECWGDYWLVKINKTNGTIKWNKGFGGTNQDALTSVQVLKDKTYLMGGYSYAHNNGTKTIDGKGSSDYYIVRTDTSGKQLWDRDYGGTYVDNMVAAKQNTDGTFILGGFSNSPVSGNKTQGIRGVTDFWILKTLATGTVKWDKTIGGNKGDYLTSLQQTADKGFLLGGYSNSDSGFEKSKPSKGDYDYWIVKLDSLGNKLWDQTYGGSGTDKLCAAIEITKNQFIFAGTSNSPVSGDKTIGTIGGTGNNDFWLLRVSYTPPAAHKTANETNSVNSVIQLPAPNTDLQLYMQAFPNPAKDNITVTYMNASDKKASVGIFSTDGKALYQSLLQSSNGTLQINIAQYSAGTYFLILKSGTSTITRAIVKK